MSPRRLVLRVCLHERALAMDALLNRLIGISFARQLHERFFPGKTTDLLSREAVGLGVAVRRSTVAVLRRTLDFASTPAAGDKRTARKFAVDQALAIGAEDRL